jgi:pimeloyl-ACP methyl ester carboxylesterase
VPERAPPPPHRIASDPRFGYGLVVPPRADHGGPPGLLVAVHDSERRWQDCLDAFSGFARAHHQVLLAPHFPADLFDDGDGDGYKFLHEHGIRHDQLLDAMVDEVADATGCDRSRFLLYGYSGGGQFAHRYFFLHPTRVRAAVIGAPGEVTLLDESTDWWAGVRDMAQRFGCRFDAAAIARVPVLLLIGERDTRADEIADQPPSRGWRSSSERIQANRLDRLRALERSLQGIGAKPRFALMPGVDHGAGWHAAPAYAQCFFAEHLHTVAAAG